VCLRFPLWEGILAVVRVGEILAVGAVVRALEILALEIPAVGRYSRCRKYSCHEYV
jgi:hypothetical protein